MKLGHLLKLFPIIICLSLTIQLTGCASTNQKIVGYEQVKAIKDFAENLDSGCYKLTNGETGEIEQIFEFFFSENNQLNYLFSYNSKDKSYQEYYNGTTLLTDKSGEIVESQVEYNRKNPHPYATGQLLFLSSSYIKSSKMEPLANISSYKYDYDIARLKNRLTSADGDVTGFSTIYNLDLAGNLDSFIQQSEVTTADGEVKSYSYTITLENANAISEIKSPF